MMNKYSLWILLALLYLGGLTIYQESTGVNTGNWRITALITLGILFFIISRLDINGMKESINNTIQAHEKKAESHKK